LFTTVHSDLRLDYESRVLGRVYSGLDRASLGPVDGFFCVSDSLRGLLLERGYPGGRLVTVRSGLEVAGAAGFGVDSVKRVGGRCRLGTTTRLVAVKDVDLLLEVTSKVRRTHPDVELVIMGDGPEREQLEARAAGMGLREAVVFTGRVDDVAERLRQLDVFLITSVYEGGVSMSVLEAMMAGLPVVVTAAGGVEEAVVDGQTGFVVTRDLERGALAAALAERAAALLDDPALPARQGAPGEFTVERTAAQTLRAYERCLAACGRL
jgi:glycosyltransferase involved in cell wall biosynthesis